MRFPRHLALLVLLAPGLARAQVVPESLLPAGAQVYYRWDGVEAHKAAYAQSGLGRMMRGDTGTFFTSLYKHLQDAASTGLIIEQLTRGESPLKLVKIQADARSAARLVLLVGQKGFILAAQMHSLEPLRVQVTLIVPDAGGTNNPVDAVLRLTAGVARAPIKEVKADGRAAAALDLDGAWLVWWAEGGHAVVSLGTDKPEAILKAAAPGKEDARLTGSPLFRRLKTFKTFPTVARGYVDVAALVKIGTTRSPAVAQLLTGLGLDGVRVLVHYSGFEGRLERTLWELEAPGPRKGLLALSGGQPFTMADVPPLPPDVVSWSMTHLDLGTLYDITVRTAEDLTRVLSPDNVEQVRALVKAANEALGQDIRNDLLGGQGDRIVEYTSPGEGPLTLGNTFLFKVKDPERLHSALARAVKGTATAIGANVKLAKKVYHGVEMRMVQVRQQGFIFVPTYAVVDGWLAVSLFPQPVEGFILRMRGELPAWKAGPEVEELLAKLPKRFVSISYSDPRPTLKQLLSIAPMLGGLTASFAPELNFDVGSLPNAQEVNRHLFPNVAVTTDDGTTLRQETRGSLTLPLDLVGLDSYGLLFLFGALASFSF
jgi:hypothetical protein